MSRFLVCSFALVLLYPAGIDMYLVGLPRIAADLNASEAQLHIAFSVYLAGMAAAMLFAGKVADRSGRKPVTIPGAALFIIASVFCSLAETSTLFLAGRFLQGWARAVVTWWRSPFYATRWMIDVGLKCCRYSTALPASFRC